MIIVSMAVIDSRLGNVPRIIANLEKQTRLPDKVLLYYSSDPWHHDKGIPELLIPKTKLDVEAIKVPNRGSCRKYLFSAERYRHTDASILLLDDDLLWRRRVIEILDSYQNESRRVVGTRGWSQFKITRDKEGRKIFSRTDRGTVNGRKVKKPTEVVVMSSGSATMFYAKDVDERMFDREFQDSVQLEYSDEIFLSAMLPTSKYIVPMPLFFSRVIPARTALFKATETPRAKALQAELLAAQEPIFAYA